MPQALPGFFLWANEWRSHIAKISTPVAGRRCFLNLWRGRRVRTPWPGQRQQQRGLSWGASPRPCGSRAAASAQSGGACRCCRLLCASSRCSLHLARLLCARQHASNAVLQRLGQIIWPCINCLYGFVAQSLRSFCRRASKQFDCSGFFHDGLIVCVFALQEALLRKQAANLFANKCAQLCKLPYTTAMHRKRRNGSTGIDQQPKALAGGSNRPNNNCDQRGCRVIRRAGDVSPGIECMGTDDGATQKAPQGFKTLEAHKTRWVLFPARAKKTVAAPGRDKFRAASREAANHMASH